MHSTDSDHDAFVQARRAAASGWLGSALEYYDFFIYATASSLVFPAVFFPAGNPNIALIAVRFTGRTYLATAWESGS